MENILVPYAEKVKNFSEVGTSNPRKVKNFNQDDKEKNSMVRPLVDDVEGKRRRGTNNQEQRKQRNKGHRSFGNIKSRRGFKADTKQQRTVSSSQLGKESSLSKTYLLTDK